VAHDLRFQVLILPNVSWSELLNRFLYVEELGFDLVGTGDHFVDWSNPPSPWFEMWTVLAAVAATTTKIRFGPSIAQIPLRNPAMFARQELTVDHISNGRLELGLGLGLTIDPSYDIMGIPNWSNKERVKRFTEYVEIVDQLLSNEVTSYKGDYYEVKDAVINPRPLQTPRPPITIAAMGPDMLKKTARYADTWNSLSFAHTFEEQLEETRGRIAAIDEHCSAIGRDPGSLRRSYLMFDAEARPKGGFIKYYESEEIFADRVRRVTALGISEIGLYYPMLEEQLPMFETIARDVIPKLKVECGTQQ
jgi:alkanesulfonate monooxygenase SsuD/methylene tetrahydromethanopterin reductase-like flavin-dependent oxidoreductase (luciferase family)